MKKVAVVGAGYVGLVTGACLAQKKNYVIMVERDEAKIAQLKKGKIPFYEPKLAELVKAGITSKHLIFVQTIAEALIEKPEAMFLCVGTPSLPDGSVNLSFVLEAMLEIGRYLTDYCLVINKSTVPVGIAAQATSIIAKQLQVRGKDIPFDVASNPEFLKEGSAVNDFLMPDRIVVGVDSKKAEGVLRELYQPFLKKPEQFLVMKRESAELTKYAANTLLAAKISFINQLALLADKVGADIAQVKRGIGSDKRIGYDSLNAGIGYGGSCFPKDVRALVSMGRQHKQAMTLAAEVDAINSAQQREFIQRIISYYHHTLSGKRAGIWGLAFKPETDDVRCAPSLQVITALLRNRCNILVYDPVAAENVKKQVVASSIDFADSSREVLEKSDFLIILTEWQEFITCKPKDFSLLRDRVVFDGRNCFEPKAMQAAGITYICVGRNASGLPAKERATRIPKRAGRISGNSFV